MKLLLEWLLRALIIFATAKLVPGFTLESFSTALVVVIILGVLNLFIKPILVLFTLPINILTLGLFTFVINAILLELTTIFVPGFHIDSLLTAIIASIVISVLSSIIGIIFS